MSSIERYVESFEKLFYDYFKEDIEIASIQGKKSFVLDEEMLGKINLELCEFLKEHPSHGFWCASEAVRQIDTAGEKLQYFRLKNLIGRTINISDIRVNHLNKLWQVEGIVRRVTDIYPIIVESVWECSKCGARIRQTELESLYELPKKRINPPYECWTEQGGCGRKTHKKLLKEECKRIDFQKIEIQEKLEQANPKSLEIILMDDLCGKINPGDKVKVVGILKSMPIRENSISMKYVFLAIYVEAIEKTFEEIEISPSDVREIEEYAKREDIYDLFIESIAPSLYGLRDEKEAIMLQLFGGVPKVKKDGTRIRGDIHILLAGDPATAKSQLLRYVCQLSPKGIYTSGKGVSTAGLTASVTKSSDFGEGKWILEAGALVLADMGIACIDELDKMDKRERDALHQGMEQQIITISKAGINATLKARCSVLAGCNPQFGRFDDFVNPVEQIKISPTLLSRFDIIMFLRDKPNEEQDRAVAQHILNLHTDEQFGEPPLSPEFIRKYVAYARSNIKPKLNREAKKKLEEFYVEARNKSTNGIRLTKRYLEGLIRLAEASAKVRLSPVATVEDAERACKLMSKFLMLDMEDSCMIEIIETGIPKNKHDKLRQVFNIIRDAFKTTKKCIPFDDMILEAEKHGITPDELEYLLEKLAERGDIFQPRYRCYAPTG